MTADGNWSLVVATPMGERPATLSVTTDGSTLRGSQQAEGNSAEIFDGTVDGNAVSWKISIVDPMPMTLEFKGTIDGDELSGSVTLGAFGDASFSRYARLDTRRIDAHGPEPLKALSEQAPRQAVGSAPARLVIWRPY